MEKTAEKIVKSPIIQLFNQIDDHIQNDEKPSEFLDSIDDEAFKSYPFSLLSGLKHIDQSPDYHPEGNVWIHTLMVVDQAAIKRKESSDARAFMWAALLHDIGKAFTTKFNGKRLTAYNHDIVGAKKAREFLEFMNEDEEFTQKVSSLVRWHMQLLYVTSPKSIPIKASIEEMVSEAPFEDICLLCLCDRLGRGGANVYAEEKKIKDFMKDVERKLEKLKGN